MSDVIQNGEFTLEPASKVVDLKGKAISVETTTSAELLGYIEKLRSTAAGEKHLAVGFFLVDAQGRCWTDFLCEAGSHLDSVGAVTILKDRVVREYEKK